jgi:hypothetical protein
MRAASADMFLHSKRNDVRSADRTLHPIGPRSWASQCQLIETLRTFSELNGCLVRRRRTAASRSGFGNIVPGALALVLAIRTAFNSLALVSDAGLAGFRRGGVASSPQSSEMNSWLRYATAQDAPPEFRF